MKLAKYKESKGPRNIHKGGTFMKKKDLCCEFDYSKSYINEI